MKAEWLQAINEMREAGYAVWFFTDDELEESGLDPSRVEDWMADAVMDIELYEKNGG